MVEKERDTNPTLTRAQAFWAYKDAVARSDAALKQRPDFFTDEHQEQVMRAYDIINQFFRVKKDIYITHRAGGNGHKPMTTIKVNSPTWGYGMQGSKKTKLHEPLKEIGVFVSTETGQGNLFHVH